MKVVAEPQGNWWRSPMPKAKKQKGRKGCRLGQAPALSRALWKKWLDWLLHTAGPRMYTAVMFTGAFGLRCSEALTLRREDVVLNGTVPRLRIMGRMPGSKKSPGDVYIRKRHWEQMRTLVMHGVTAQRSRGHKHGKAKFEETFTLPKKGYIFKSRRRSGKNHLSYHAVYKHVRRQAPKLLQHLKKSCPTEEWGEEIAALRPHSGRATLITQLMGEGMSTALSMKYARHAPGSVKVHLRYGRLMLEDVKSSVRQDGRNHKEKEVV